MAIEDAERYQVDIAREDPQNLKEVLEHIATRPGHIGIVSVMYRPRDDGPDGFSASPGYTIVSERDPNA